MKVTHDQTIRRHGLPEDWVEFNRMRFETAKSCILKVSLHW